MYHAFSAQSGNGKESIFRARDSIATVHGFLTFVQFTRDAFTHKNVKELDILVNNAVKQLTL